MAEQRIKYIIEFDVKTGQSQIQGLDGKLIATANSAKQLTAEVGMLSGGKDGAGGMEGLSKKTGGAASAALELGRVVSDAPYGIRGMANNVSQLSSQILYMAQQTDAGTGKVVGFGGALKGVFAALKGPLGVLLAIQVVISAVDYFFGGMKKAEGAAKDLNKELKNQIDIFRLYDQQLSDANVSLEERLKIVKAVSTFDKDLSKQLREANGDIEKQTKIIEKHTKQKELELKIKEQEVILNDAIAKEKEADIKLSEEQLDTKVTLRNQGLAGLGLGKSVIIQSADEKTANEEKREAQKSLNEALKTYTDLLSQLDVEEGDEPKRIKEFKQNLLDLSSEIDSFRDKEIQNADISEEERLRLEYDASRKSVENKRLEFKDKEDERLDAILKEVNDSKSTEDEKARLIEDAYQKYNEAQIQANEDLRSVMLQADIAYYAELSALRREDTEAAKEESKDLIAALTENNFDYQEFNETQKINAATNDLNRIRDELKGSQLLTDLKVSGLEKELLAEEGNVVKQQEIRNKIAKLNQDQTLYEEELDRKSAIAKIGIAMQIADTIAAIAGEGSGIAKGVAVAQTIWNTKQAFMAALGSAPYGPWNIAQALAVGVMGVKNVNDILATKAPNEKSADVSAKNAAMSGGGGGSAFNPNFNIVGASGGNQLAETVAGQIGEPTRAYVVYDDIATAGEIEANAIEASGI
jgi:hypothetical protein